MYTIKNPGIIEFKYGENKKIAKQIGITAEHLCSILSGKTRTKYATAYCIVKLFNSEKEVLDYFNQID